jgi:prepilin-type N-terminal cleavage/methylation domain-containing protein
MTEKLRQSLRSRKRRQGGFTLIEMLVVITILGILAAIVSVSLLGFTSTARKNALLAEKQTVQTAFDAMMHDQHVDPGDLPTAGCDGSSFTTDMTNFPSKGAAYSAPDPSAGGVVTVLSTHYLRQTTTSDASYSCDSQGNILQKAK